MASKKLQFFKSQQKVSRVMIKSENWREGPLNNEMRSDSSHFVASDGRRGLGKEVLPFLMVDSPK